MKVLIYYVVTTESHLEEFISDFAPVSQFDYALFTSVPLHVKPERLEVIHIEERDGLNLRQLSRVAKMNPQKFLDLSSYHYSIYADSNIQVAPDVLSYLDRSKPVVLFKHNRRNFLLSEICYCYYTGKMSFVIMLKTIWQSQSLKFRKGLYQGGLLIRKSNNAIVEKLNSSWYDNYLRLTTDRDQISLAMAVYPLKQQIKVVNQVLHSSEGITLRAHDKVVYDLKGDLLQRLFVFVRKIKSK
ncbi:MAG: hypothetical protein HEP71_28105 [Roseivirga sp.]|nr:hypothetical protein [Roseivirga sp.]